jgi:hypothetical protein
MVSRAGFEPAIATFEAWCFLRLSYRLMDTVSDSVLNISRTFIQSYRDDGTNVLNGVSGDPGGI